MLPNERENDRARELSERQTEKEREREKKTNGRGEKNESTDALLLVYVRPPILLRPFCHFSTIEICSTISAFSY